MSVCLSTCVHVCVSVCMQAHVCVRTSVSSKAFQWRLPGDLGMVTAGGTTVICSG